MRSHRTLTTAIASVAVTLATAAVAMAGSADLDLGFGANGAATVDAGGTERTWALAAQLDGKVVGVGYLATGDGAVHRLNEDGKRDTSFAGDGLVRLDSGATDEIHGLAVQHILTVGATGANVGTNPHVDGVVHQLRSDGTPDPTFDADGELRITRGTFFGFSTMTREPNGRILLAGDGLVNGADAVVLRLEGERPVDTTPGEPTPGTPPPPSPAAPSSRDTRPPTITRLAFSPRRFRAAAGARLRFALSEPAACASSSSVPPPAAAADASDAAS